MGTITYEEIEREVSEQVKRVHNDPEGRYQMRVAFYEKYGGGPEGGFGTSELAFMRWEIERGVLNPPDDPQTPGSPWWKHVNEAILYNAALAAEIHERGLARERASQPVGFWLDYIEQPAPRAWYRAHNASIVQGYLDNEDLIHREGRAEQIFVNVVLYRLLFAQAMVEDTPEGFGELGEVMADPLSPAVDILVHLPSFYPRHYPLSHEGIRDVMHRGHTIFDGIEDFFDEVIILPRLGLLYNSVARWLSMPRLRHLIKGHAVNYPPAPSGPRKKVAVLGGGVGAMVAAFALTDPDNPNAQDYDVTLYQIGWRLGGKGASGRNVDPALHNRIQEHGLHIWFGFYDNAFHTIRKAYDALNQIKGPDGVPLRAPDAPLGTWEAAFKPFGTAVIKQDFQDRWESWVAQFPPNDLVPGDGGLLPIWTYGGMALGFLFKSFRRTSTVQGVSPTGQEPEQFVEGERSAADRFVARAEDVFLRWMLWLLHRFLLISRAVDFGGELLMAGLGLMMRRHWKQVKDRVHTDIEANRAWTVSNFIYAAFRGIFADKLLEKGFDSINDYEFREWIANYAFDDGGILLNSGFMLNIYDGSFAYVDGDNSTPPGASFPPKANMEAGTTLRAGIRFFATYKGAPVWKMQAGMGDTIFGPLYLVLKERGVKFKFFHRVKSLHASEDGQTIDQILVEEQVRITPEQEAQGGYAPLIDVKGLPCWPSEPRWDQVVGGEKLKEQGVDLESYCGPPGSDHTLVRGQDFDEVILGISLGAIPYICEDLIEKSGPWKKMVDNIKTVRTQSYQLWLKPTAYMLGWTTMQRPVLTAYEYQSANPVNTWADMSHLIRRETWPNEHFPGNIAYFTGPMIEEPLPVTKWGPRVDCELMDQKKENGKVLARAVEMLNGHMEPLWPKALVKNGESGKLEFNWDLLIDARPDAPQGEERLASQYWIANVKPSERYVLSVAGSSRYRPPPNNPDEFANLYLAGDWTDNHLNFGCVEAATMSGLMAS
ncbi:MAG: NAD(P)-binding protein, partial [Anaerolineales bacterium]|nr:NAD(P)-binding protein [Anaerolineales bacterium]